MQLNQASLPVGTSGPMSDVNTPLDYQKMYDEADDASFNNKGTVNINNKGTDHLILKNLLYTL